MIDGKLIAQARDAWLKSEEGQKCLDTDIMHSPYQGVYLRNRLEQAFLAGVKAAEKIIEEQNKKA